jgi:hypothetical protein
MSKQLHNAMEEILKMPYYKNEHARSGEYFSGHEDAVADKLNLSGFLNYSDSDCKKNINKKIINEWIKSTDDTAVRAALSNMPSGSYIQQPLGSQQFPDFLIKDFDGRFISAECKSTKGKQAPMWNDNVPKPNTIYIFSSEKEDSTTVFLGKDVITEEAIEILEEHYKTLKLLEVEFNKSMAKLDKYCRGWASHFRRQNFQEGGLIKTNYFTHEDRKYCESEVLRVCNGET